MLVFAGMLASSSELVVGDNMVQDTLGGTEDIHTLVQTEDCQTSEKPTEQKILILVICFHIRIGSY